MNAVFSDLPHRGSGEMPIYAVIAGRRFENVRIEVSVATYIDARFQSWLREVVFTRIFPGSPVHIVVR